MMKTNLKMTNVRANEAAVRAAAMRDRLYAASEYTAEELLGLYNVPAGGLTDALAERSRDEYGANILTNGKKDSAAKRLAEAFISPFTLVLLALAVISVFTDIVFASAGERSYATVGIISAMVIISGTLRYVQETRSCNVAEKLTGMLHTTACVERGGAKREIPIEEIVVGDLIHLSAGDMIPADLRILTAKDLFISQSALTGESEPVEKTACSGGARDTLTDTENLAFMGSNVVSGSATAVAVAVGNGTMLGNMAGSLNGEAPKTAFEKGVNSVSWVLIRFMLIMVPVVLFINGFTKGDWVQALLFAISVAVGLTPEMLPMIVTACLAKGAVVMSREKVIIKNLNSIQNLGSMDILCTDKTGTLTQDRVVLEYHLNVDGAEDERVLRHAFLNSYFQTGLKNLIDIAVIARQQELGTGDLTERYTKVDEIPFDFERRRMSVVVRDRAGKTQLVTKGAVEEMLKCCSFAECGGSVLPLTDEVRSLVTSRSDAMNEQGMRVIAVAQKTNPAPAGEFSAADERDMVLIGFLAFLDPPKDTTKAAVQALTEYGVSVKILTGDNEKVTRAICSQVGLDAENMLLGSEIDALTDAQLGRLAAGVTVFAKLSPAQNARIVSVLRERGHSEGGRRGYICGHRRGHCKGNGRRRAAGKRPHGAGARRDRGTKNIRQYDKVHKDNGVVQFREHALRARVKRISAVFAHGFHTPDTAESHIRRLLHRHVLGQRRRGISQVAAQMGCRRHQPLHAPNRPHKLRLRHSDLPAYVLCHMPRVHRRRAVHEPHRSGEPGAVRLDLPDGLVRRIHVEPGAGYTHAAHAEAPVRAEPRRCACDPAHACRKLRRHGHTVHSAWQGARLHGSPGGVLPVAGGYSCRVHAPGYRCQEVLCAQVRRAAVKKYQAGIPA